MPFVIQVWMSPAPIAICLMEAAVAGRVTATQKKTVNSSVTSLPLNSLQPEMETPLRLSCLVAATTSSVVMKRKES